jgi:hypothetical protein
VRYPIRSTFVNAAELSVGASQTFVRDEDGAIRCAGFNGRGALGNARRTTEGSPQTIEDFTGVTAVAAGGEATCATKGGQMYCWGVSNNGEVGTGTFENVYAPAPAGGAFKEMAGGGDHFCGITMTGDVYCWGYNAEGQLGDGKTVSRAYPGAVVTGGVATSIAAGDLHVSHVPAGSLQSGDGLLAGHHRIGFLLANSHQHRLAGELLDVELRKAVLVDAGHRRNRRPQVRVFLAQEPGTETPHGMAHQVDAFGVDLVFLPDDIQHLQHVHFTELALARLLFVRAGLWNRQLRSRRRRAGHRQGRPVPATR